MIGSILARQKERGHAPIPFRDDPQAVFPVALARLGRVNRIGGKNAGFMLERRVIGLSVVRAYFAPVAA